jgi:uncharacterized membrane protein YraQ (UPF0718 family)
MSLESIIIFNGIIFISFIFLSVFRWEKSKKSVFYAWKSAKKFTPILLFIFLLILIIQGVFSSKFVFEYITKIHGAVGFFSAAIIGAIAHIPLFVAVPLSAELILQDVNIGFVAALLNSLIGVHTFSIPLEIKEMGLKFALIRNGLAFIFAIFAGIIMGGVL